MKVLIVLPNDFSACLLATPLIRSLNNRFSDARLHVLTGKEGREALAANPFLQQVHIWQVSRPVNNGLKDEAFSFAVDLQNDVASRTLLTPLGIETVKTEKHWLPQVLSKIVGRKGAAGKRLIGQYFETVAPLRVYDDGKGVDYFVPKEATVQSHDIPHSHHAGFVTLSISASAGDVKLPLAALQSLCNKIHHPIILTGRREEAGEGEAIASVDPVKIYNSCGKFSAAETADLLRQSKLVIGSDAATVQLAAALKKELIAVGENDSWFGPEEYYGAKYLQQHRLPCDVVPLRKRWLRRHNKSLSIDAVVNKVSLRLRRRAEQ